MAKRVKVTAIKKEEPDTYLYVLALIAFARQQQEEAARQATPPSEQAASEEPRHD